MAAELKGGSGFALWAGLAAAAGLGLVSLHVPFGRDQGVAAYAAEVMARGGGLYRDFYHFNLPGIFFIYRMARSLPFPLVESVNLVHVVFLVLTCLAVHRAGREVLAPWPAVLAGLFYAAFAVVLYTDYWDIAQKESLASLPLALALWFLLRLGRGPSLARGRLILRAGLFGLFCGAAAQFKPTLGVVLLGVAAPAWSARRPAESLTLIISAAAGFLLSFLPLLFYLLGRGSLAAMMDSVFRFGGFYGGQSYEGLWTAGRAVLQTAGWAYRWSFLVALAVIGLAGAPLSGKCGEPEGSAVVSAPLSPEQAMKWTALFFGLLLFQVLLQMKFFTYHWVPLLLPCSLLAAAGVRRLWATAPRRPVALILFALFLGNLGPAAGRYRRELNYDLGRLPRNNFLAAYGKWGQGDLCPLASQAVADYVREHSRPSDPLLVFGLEPGLYLLAERMAPTRFAYDQPLVTDPRGHPAFTAYRERLRREFMADLRRRPALYIVVVENDQTGIEAEDSYHQMLSFPEFRSLLEREYVLETKIEDYFIYRRLAESGG